MRSLLWFQRKCVTEDAPKAALDPEQVREQCLRRFRRRRQRGVALIMVLGTLSILTVMLTEFQDETASEVSSAMAARDAVVAEYAAKSGVNLTRLLIAAEPTVRTAIAPLFMMMGQSAPQIPVWEYADKVLGAFGDQEGAEAFQGISGTNLAEGRNLGMEKAGFRIQVVDEDSKINLNVAARPGSQQRIAMQIRGLLGNNPTEELFSKPDLKGKVHDRYTICSALIDWADPDETLEACDPLSQNAPQTGTEDSYYQMLPRPYQRKNAGYDSLQELYLVRGISDQVFDRFFYPDPDDPTSRTVTVWGQGAINVNTANPATLLALICSGAVENTPLCIDPQQQMTFLMTLGMMKSMMPGIPVFGTKKAFVSAVKGTGAMGTMLVSMGFQPVKLISESTFEQSISVESKVFSIYSTGYVKTGKKEIASRIHAVVDLRNAPAPGAAAQRQLDRASGGTGTSTMQVGGTTVDQDTLASLTAPNPGGMFLYYRVD